MTGEAEKELVLDGSPRRPLAHMMENAKLSKRGCAEIRRMLDADDARQVVQAGTISWRGLVRSSIPIRSDTP